MNEKISKRYSKEFLLSLGQTNLDNDRIKFLNQNSDITFYSSKDSLDEICDEFLTLVTESAKQMVIKLQSIQPEEANLKIDFIKKLILTTAKSNNTLGKKSICKVLIDSTELGIINIQELEQALMSVLESPAQNNIEFDNLNEMVSKILEFILEIQTEAKIEEEEETKEKSLSESSAEEKSTSKESQYSKDKQVLVKYRRVFKNLFEKNLDDENAFLMDRIKTEFSQNDFNSKDFIGTLALSLCKSCVNKTDNTFNTDLFTNRSSILEKFINSNELFAFEVLKAARALNEALKMPPDFLQSVFEVLYDMQIIKTQTFFEWKKMDEKNNQTAISLLKNFFNNI